MTVSTHEALVQVTPKDETRTLPSRCEEARAATGKTEHRGSGGGPSLGQLTPGLRPLPPPPNTGE